jgi:hypothetical protein
MYLSDSSLLNYIGLLYRYHVGLHIGNADHCLVCRWIWTCEAYLMHCHAHGEITIH